MITDIRISEGIFPIDRFGKMGHVHSVFQHSFNIEIGGQLINISNHHAYLSGFGLYLPDVVFQEIYPFVQQGNIVKIVKDEWTVYSLSGSKTIRLKQMTVVPLRLAELEVHPAQLQQLEKQLEIHHLEKAIGLETDTKANEMFHSLRKAETIHSPTAWQKIVSYLIGRGKGLTPSGDDILTAYLSILSMVGDPQAEALSSALTDQELSTTDISKAYIISSIHGYVNSLVYQLFLDLQNQEHVTVIERGIEKIRAIGHSSGTDLCFGLLLGLQKINMPMNTTR